jgi:plastocyanin
MISLVIPYVLLAALLLSPAAQEVAPIAPVVTAQDPSGVITGKVEVRAAPQPMRMERGTRYRSGTSSHDPEAASDAADEKNVVVYLEGEKLEGVTVQRPSKAVMDQKNEKFIPHVLAVQKGASIDFVNHDRVYHNVFSLSAPKKFNIGRRPTGQEVPIKFDKQGVVQVFCDIHSQMTGFVVVLDNPFFVQPEEDGSFRIDHVPPGTYTIKVWHERLTASEQKITVAPGGTVKANFVLE